MQQLAAAGSQPGGVAPSPVPGMQQAARGEPDQLVGNLNTYVRSKLSKSEVPSFADTTRALGESQISVRSVICSPTFAPCLLLPLPAPSPCDM